MNPNFGSFAQHEQFLFRRYYQQLQNQNPGWWRNELEEEVEVVEVGRKKVGKCWRVKDSAVAVVTMEETVAILLRG